MEDKVTRKPFTYVRVHFVNGDQMETEIRLSPRGAISYYLGKSWTFFDSLKGKEYTTIADRVEILSPEGKVIKLAEIGK